MDTIDTERRALKGGIGVGAAALNEPIAITLREAIRLGGLSRSDLYRRAGAGQVIFRKSGATVVVDYASLKALVTSLPLAQIGPPPVTLREHNKLQKRGLSPQAKSG